MKKLLTLVLTLGVMVFASVTVNAASVADNVTSQKCNSCCEQVDSGYCKSEIIDNVSGKCSSCCCNKCTCGCECKCCKCKSCCDEKCTCGCKDKCCSKAECKCGCNNKTNKKCKRKRGCKVIK